MLLLKHRPTHDLAQLRVGEEEMEKEKGREGSGVRKLNKSFPDRSSPNIKYFYYVNC